MDKSTTTRPKAIFPRITEFYYRIVDPIYTELWPDLGMGEGSVISAGFFLEPVDPSDNRGLEDMRQVIYEAQQEMLRQTVGRLELDKFPSGSTVLELGFGFGQKLIAMAKARPDLNFIGVNVSPEQHEFVAEQLTTRGIENVTLIDTDMSNLSEIANDSIDAVLSTEAMFHTKHKNTLTEISRVLKPGGKYVITTITNKGLSPMDEATFRSMGAIRQFLNLESLPHVLSRLELDMDFKLEDISANVAPTMPLTVKIFEMIKDRFNPAMRFAMGLSWKRLGKFYAKGVGYVLLTGRKQI